MSIRLRRRISTGSMPNARRRLVHQPFEREGDDRPRHAAIRRHGAGVGQHAARAAFIVLDVVRPGHFRHRHQRLDAAGGREAGIGADIGDDVGFQRDQFGVLVEGALQRDVLVARMEAGDQVLAPVLGPGERALVSCAPARPARRIPARATSSGRSRRRRRARSRADRLSGMPSTSAMAVRVRCGICVVQVSVTRPVDGVVGGVAGARLHRRRVLAVRARVDA